MEAALLNGVMAGAAAVVGVVVVILLGVITGIVGLLFNGLPTMISHR